MQLIDILGLFALIITVTYTGFGLPVQIYKNFRTRSTQGLSLSMVILMFCTFSSWTIYGLLNTPPDWYIFLANLIGLLSATIILFQFWIYRLQPHKKR
jgi:uncharacterized protein with PQ loop repeat